jgi:methyltransferase OMS1
MRARHVVAGAGLYLAVAGSTYAWVKSRQSVAKDATAAAAAAKDADAVATKDALLGACGPAAAAAATARRFDALSRCYDDTVGGEETWMLYGLLRSRLLRNAKGKILEINAGTGRNLPHFSWRGVDELTLVDGSARMLRAAERKFYDAPLKVGYRQPHVRARFCLGDAQDLVAGQGEAARAPPLPRVAAEGEAEAAGGAAAAARESRPASSGFSRLWRAAPRQGQEEEEEEEDGEADEVERAEASGGRQTPPPRSSSSSSSSSSSGSAAAEAPPPPQPLQKAKFAPGSFDVVVDTFGLCSVEDPVRALREAGRLVKPGTGRILLLEHGRPPDGTLGSWLLSERMDAAAPAHKARWGCWFNRDIDAAVRDSGLRVVSRGTWHFGTTYVYELMRAEDAAVAAAAAAAAAAALEADERGSG